MKVLNIRFRCFLVKVHELERRNQALETQLRVLREATCSRCGAAGGGGAGWLVARGGYEGSEEDGGGGGGGGDWAAMEGFEDGSGYLGHPGSPGSSALWEGGCPPGSGFPLGLPSGAATPEARVRPMTQAMATQADTITPELRALYNVLAMTRREREEFRRRWDR
uniref:Intermediate filament family orphan 2-like n=1 Tax=Petromyzon marinus TaxID=7757 RepID=A0AAJ7WLT1_PETMA